jgi:hypothetical protein
MSQTKITVCKMLAELALMGAETVTPKPCSPITTIAV